MNNQLTTQPKFSVVIQSNMYKNLINNTLGDPERAKRFVASISSAVSQNPALQECDPKTIVSGALVGEALNLSPSNALGQFYLVPYNNNKTGVKEAVFQMGYRGLIQLAIRSGQYKDIDVIDIKEGEFKGRDKDTGAFKFEFIEDEADRVLRPTIGYLGYFELLNGFRKTLYVSKEAMEQHANKYSKAFDLATYKKIQAGQIPEKDMWKYSSFWYSNFDMMAYKTIIRQLLSRYGVLSIEMQNAFTKDMAVIRDNENYEYVDNPSEDAITITPEEIQETAEKQVKPKKTRLSEVE